MNFSVDALLTSEVNRNVAPIRAVADDSFVFPPYEKTSKRALYPTERLAAAASSAVGNLTQHRLLRLVVSVAISGCFSLLAMQLGIDCGDLSLTTCQLAS